MRKLIFALMLLAIAECTARATKWHANATAANTNILREAGILFFDPRLESAARASAARLGSSTFLNFIAEALPPAGFGGFGAASYPLPLFGV
jgi:hypothetical protein